MVPSLESTLVFTSQSFQYLVSSLVASVTQKNSDCARLAELITVIINRNVCIDILAKENKHSINVQIDEKIKEISEDYDHFEQLIVADMIEKLPDIYRDVIMMKYFYGFKVKEISKQLHLSVGGVKSRLEKARKILRKDMNDDE